MAIFEGAEIGLRARDEASPVFQTAAQKMEASMVGLGSSIARLSATFLSITAVLKGLSTGFKWVEKFEEAEQQIAGLVMNFNKLTDATGKPTEGMEQYTQAIGLARIAMAELREVAFETDQSSEAITGSFAILMRSVKGTSGEITELTKSLAIMADINRMSVEEFSTSLARVLETGQYMSRGAGIALAKALKVPAETIKEWNDLGLLPQKLNERLKQTPELMEALRNTTSNVYRDVGLAAEKAWGQLVKGPVDALKPGVEALTKLLSSDAFLNPLREIGRVVVEWIRYFKEVEGVGSRLPSILDLVGMSIKGLVALSMIMEQVWRNVGRILVSIASVMADFAAKNDKAARGIIGWLKSGWGGSAESMKGEQNESIAKVKEVLDSLGGYDYDKTVKGLDNLVGALERLFNPKEKRSKFAEEFMQPFDALNRELDKLLARAKEEAGNRETKKPPPMPEFTEWDKAIQKATQGYDEFKLKVAEELKYVGLTGLEGEIAKINAEFDTSVEKMSAWRNTLMEAGYMTKEEADALLATLEKIRDLKVTKARTDAIKETETLEERFRRLYETATTVTDGIEAGMLGITLAAKSTGQAVSDAMVDGFFAVKQGFEDVLFDGLTSGFSNLTSILKGIFDALLRNWIRVIATMVQEAIGGFGKIKAAAAGRASAGSGLGGMPTVDENGQPWDAGAGGGLDYAGLGWSGGNAIGMAIGGAVGKGSIWGQIGGMALGIGMGATAYASVIAGALTVPVVGWIAAAVGAIVIALGALLKKSTQEWETLVGTQILPGIRQTSRGNEVWQRYGAVLGNFFDVMKAGGGKGTDLIKEIRWNKDEFLRSTQIKWGAGSSEDRRDLWKQYLDSFFPKTMLSMAFGRQQQVIGGVPQYESFPGIGGNFQGIPKFTGGAGFDATTGRGTTALVRMLQDMGFVNDRISQIAEQIDVREADAFIEWLTKMVTVVKGFQTLATEFGKSAADYFAQFDAEDAESPAAKLQSAAADILDYASVMDSFVGDDQLKRAGDLLKMGEDFQKQMVEALREIHTLIKQINEQATKTVRDARFALMTPAQQETELRARAAQGVTDLGAATSVSQVRKAVGAIQEAYTGLFNVLIERITALRGLVDGFRALKELVQGPRMLDPTKGLMAFLDADWSNIMRALQAFRDSNSTNIVQNAHTLYSALQSRYQYELQMLDQIRALITEIRTSVADTIFQNNLSLMNPQQQADTIGDYLESLYAQLGEATSPEEVRRLWGEIQRYSQQYLALFDPNDPNRPDAVTWVNQLLTDAGDMAGLLLEGWGETLEQDIGNIGLLLAEAEGRLSTALGQATTDFETAVTAYTTAMTDATIKLEGFGVELTDLAGTLTTAMTDVAALFTELQEDLGGTETGGGGVNRKLDDLAEAAGNAADALNLIATTSAAANGGANVTVNVEGGGVDPDAVAQMAYDAVFQALNRGWEVA